MKLRPGIINRTLIALLMLFGALVSAEAHAQGEGLPDETMAVAWLLSNELDAYYGCYGQDLFNENGFDCWVLPGATIGIHRLEIELVMMSFSDITPFMPWQRDTDGSIHRGYLIAGKEYLIILDPANDARESRGVIKAL